MNPGTILVAVRDSDVGMYCEGELATFIRNAGRSTDGFYDKIVVALKEDNEEIAVFARNWKQFMGETKDTSSAQPVCEELTPRQGTCLIELLKKHYGVFAYGMQGDTLIVSAPNAFWGNDAVVIPFTNFVAGAAAAIKENVK